MPEDIHLEIGQTVEYDFCPPSKVVGVDHYTLSAFDGQRRHWDSYTLVSEDKEGPYSRWWIVNVPDMGAHFYVAAERVPEGAAFSNRLSGYVRLNSEGNADLSGDRGALAVYQAADGMLYAEEVFEGAPRLVFMAGPLPQS